MWEFLNMRIEPGWDWFIVHAIIGGLLYWYIYYT